MSLNTDTYAAAGLVPYAEAEEAVTESVPFAASLTLAKGTVVGYKTADGKWAAYASGNADGTQVPRGILQYAITTDGSGKVTVSNEKGVTYDTAPVFVEGIFRTTELTGLDANAVGLLGRLLAGTAADGVLKLT